MHRIASLGWLFAAFLILPGSVQAAQGKPQLSSTSTTCQACHASVHPGIVEGWKKSLHSRSSPAMGMAKPELERRISARNVPEDLREVSVGCAECHTLNPESHADTFNHNGFQVHTVVTPEDCAVCHPQEREQFTRNIMSQARGNLIDNPVFSDLQQSIIGPPTLEQAGLRFGEPDRLTTEEACLYCHGTKIEVQGQEQRKTVMGPMTFPVLKGWPNQGVGRLNPDGSLGSCSACHTRHDFSIVTARKPYTCKECHIGPDVPAYKVYSTSKHGNIFSTHESSWDFEAVPWKVGQDFTAPTCAACHMSLTVTPQGKVVAQRTHQVNNRLATRLFGLIYAHAHPKDPDTTKIRNSQGLPLPTDFQNRPASEFLISKEEQAARRTTMQAICTQCHGGSWTANHFERLDNTIATTNQATLTGTTMMLEAWDLGLASGLAQGQSLFDEGIEKLWSRTWLIDANTVRFASAMAGGGDYGVFANGRYELATHLAEMRDWIELRKGLEAQPASD